MSALNIQFGQCGNQIGFDFFNTIATDLRFENDAGQIFHKNSYVSDGIDRWFYPSNKNSYCARAILIDTEPKVIRDVCRKASLENWTYNPKNVICQKHGGSGNNWALGYSRRGNEMKELIMESIRREIESYDQLTTLCTINSSAGGTGSGVGSKIITCLRDAYPSKCMINSVVLPYQSGEIMTQHYNTVLTLAATYGVSDMQIIFQNDHVQKLCSSVYGDSSVTLANLNNLISVKLLSFLQPVNKTFQSSLPNIVADLTPHPQYKFVTIKSGPHMVPNSLQYSCYSNANWNIILKYLTRTLRTSGLNQEVHIDWNVTLPTTKVSKNFSVKYYQCIANMLVSRGGNAIDVTDMKDFNLPELYPRWIPNNSQFYYHHQHEPLLKFNKFLALISNNYSTNRSINDIVKRAWIQFSSKAYLHHYTNYMSQDDIFEAFVKIEDVIKSYDDLNTS